jgi:hypothetical protein
MDQSQKDHIYNLILQNKMKIFNKKNKEDRFKEFIVKNNINFNFEITISDVISYLKNVNKKCFIEGCNNRRKFIGFRTKRTEYGFQKYCSKKCEYLSISIRQSGKNNTCHRMTNQSFESMCSKNSEKMKMKISTGEFTPCITNSWSCSKTELYLNEKLYQYRSSWEAFFHLCNPHLEYETIRIPYFYKNKNHNYIVDFVYNDNKRIYEIKPKRCFKNSRVSIKKHYAEIWCENNGFKLIVVSDDWFEINFPKYKSLLIGQKNAEIISKKLKQFS